jgi:DNA-binding transcriptional LysR family regulator
MPAGDERFHGRLLFPIHVLAVLPETHRLSRRSVLDVADLADEALMLMGHGFASRAWFNAACQVAHISPRVIVESAAPQTLIALARADYGIALVPSPMRIARERIRIVPVVHRGESIGRWTVIAWDPQRFLAPYAHQFVEEVVSAVRRDYPGRDLVRRAPPLPRPKEPRANRAR